MQGVKLHIHNLCTPVSSEASSGASKNDLENSNSRSSGEMVEVDKVFFEALLNSFKRQKQIREATKAAHATLNEMHKYLCAVRVTVSESTSFYTLHSDQKKVLATRKNLRILCLCECWKLWILEGHCDLN